jgi:hypothetical protein
MGVRTYDRQPVRPSRPAGPGLAPALGVSALAFVLLIANGRPVGSPLAGGAASAVLGALLAAAGPLLEADPTTRAVLGKVFAAVAAAVAAGALFAAVARRQSFRDARTAGLVLAVGTTLLAAAQSWSGEVPATAAVALAVLLLVRADVEDDPKPASGAALLLAAAVVLSPPTWALALVLAAAPFFRFPRHALRLLAWTAPAVVLALLGIGLGSRPPLSAPDPEAVLALLASPARGAFVFAPVLLVGLVGTLRALGGRSSRAWHVPGRRWLPTAVLLGVVAHVGAVALDGGFGRGLFWGPRLVSPVGPPLLLFLPEGLALLRLAGAAVVLLSVAVQALGAFAYTGRWDRLHASAGTAAEGGTWSLSESPVAFQIHERVLVPALLGIDGRRLVVREHPLVLDGPTGSRIAFIHDVPFVTGADPALGDALLEGGARIEVGRLRLQAPDDALFFRVQETARLRRLELRIHGRGPGTLAVGEKTFWTEPVWHEHAVGESFRLRLPWSYAESGGGDIRVVARGGKPLELESVDLVPPSTPEDVFRTP